MTELKRQVLQDSFRIDSLEAEVKANRNDTLKSTAQLTTAIIGLTGVLVGVGLYQHKKTIEASASKFPRIIERKTGSGLTKGLI